MIHEVTLTYDKWGHEHHAVLTHHGRTVKATGRTEDEAIGRVYEKAARPRLRARLRTLFRRA